MLMRRYLLKFDEFPIDKNSVQSGQNSSEVVTACRCVNIGLFISGGLRQDVVVSIAIGTPDDLMVVSFAGNTLKRVSPDERSISFFLLKAVERAHNLKRDESFTMDNGIELIRSSYDGIIELWGSGTIHVPSTNPERFILDMNLSMDLREVNP
jgi:tRNA pseudouridine-54 N-methylase